MLPLHPGSREPPRPAERLTGTKGKVGLGQGNADSEDKTEDYKFNTTRHSHTIFLAQIGAAFNFIFGRVKPA